MKKNLRSVKRNEEGNYEYFRVDVEEAARLESIGGYIYINKEEFKRQSKFYTMYPCQGTVVNIKPFVDEKGVLKTQKYYTVFE